MLPVRKSNSRASLRLISPPRSERICTLFICKANMLHSTGQQIWRQSVLEDKPGLSKHLLEERTPSIYNEKDCCLKCKVSSRLWGDERGSNYSRCSFIVGEDGGLQSAAGTLQHSAPAFTNRPNKNFIYK